MHVAQSRTDSNAFARELFDGLPARYDVLAEVLSFGQNRRWRNAMVRTVTENGGGQADRILDVATGTAGVALLLEAHSTAQVTAIDLTEQMIRQGRANVLGRTGPHRIDFVIGRGEQLPFADNTFDALTFTYLLRYVADPAATIAELARVVRPGGVVANLEFGVPSSAVFRIPWIAYTRVVLPLAGLLTGGPEWFRVGRFLGPSITEHYRRYPLSWHIRAWQQAGLRSVTARPMSLGGGLVMSGRVR
jgi:demethylmenaquinone methyltransferase/2-methoxy-6-polyprenyl-1,4-benzoquinol methylase